MFTGIVREVGRVAEFDGHRLVVEAQTTAAEGDSVAVDGVCLTAIDGSRLAFDVVGETLGRTTLGGLKPGDSVNLEPALRAGDPLGGHYVQGHVDGVGRVRSAGTEVWVDAPAELLRHVVIKGSITVDGVSLTVAALDDRGFGVALVPHTLAATTFGELQPGDAVNLETDVLAKYVERLVSR
ncbi:MAG TPA: riboflavin synthase [Gaiellaceae bacterium]|jgi:riboflavin synthase